MQDAVLALGRTEDQHYAAVRWMSGAAYQEYHETFVAAGHVHTEKVKAAQFRWYQLNRICVEVSRIVNRVGVDYAKEFVAEGWMHECSRTSKRDGIPVYTGTGWKCSRCHMHYEVDHRGCSRERAVESFWRYDANSTFLQRN